MIVLDQVTMQFTTASLTNYSRTRTVLFPTSLAIPSDRRIAFFADPAEDRRMFIDLIGGLVLPSAGRIVRRVSVSFPVGHLGSFEPRLAVKNNIAHLARLYGADVQMTVDFVESLAGLGEAFNKPFGMLSSLEKKTLGRIVAYSIPFDLYLLTDDAVFGKKKLEDISARLFEARSRTAGMIIPTRNMRFAREHCDMGLVLDHGKLRLFDDVEQALAVLPESMARPVKVRHRN